MAVDTHTIRVGQDVYDRLTREAAHRGVEPDALADELLRNDLTVAQPDELDQILDELAELRKGLPTADAVALIRAGRDELEAR